MVSKLREGWPVAGRRSATSGEIIDILGKRLTVAAPPQQKKIHLKLGVIHFPARYMTTAVEHPSSRTAPWPRSTSAGRR